MSDTKKLFSLLPHLIDDETGILSHVVSLPRQQDMPDFFYYKALVGNTGIFDGPENFAVSGGTSVIREKALVKAIGEGIERYSSAVYHLNDLPLGSSRDLPFETINAESFGQCYEGHFFKEHDILHWSPATRVSDQAKIHVPSALVYCPYQADSNSGEKEIAEQISTGLAAHVTFEQAVLNGLLEVVERDAFMLNWMSGIPLTLINKESLSASHLEIMRRFEKYGYEIALYDIRSDNTIPSIMAIMEGERESNVPLLFAAATHLDPVIAVSKCLEELALIERYAKRLYLDKDRFIYKDPSDVHLLRDHVAFWFDKERRAELKALLHIDRQIDLTQIQNLSTVNYKDDLQKAFALVLNTGHEIYIADCSAEDIASLGLFAVRVIVPGYLPLNKEHGYSPKNSVRLQKVLHDSGRMLNEWPHPFA